MKRILIICTFLLVGVVTALANLKSWDDDVYKNADGTKKYVITREMWICSSVTFPVDIAMDAFHVNYDATLGTFEQVEPGNPEGPPLDSTVKGGIFNVTGRPAGVYEFVFTSKINNFCGMGIGEKSVVRVYVVPELVEFSSLVNLCAGESEIVDLSHYVPYEVKNFANEVGWTLQFFEPGVGVSEFIDATGKVNTSIKNVGVRTYAYTYNDDAGDFSGKFDSMIPSYKCEDSAAVMHNVRIRSTEAVVIPPKEITFCLDNLLAVPQNTEKFYLNLKSLLGAEAKDGVWAVSLYSDSGDDDDDGNEYKAEVTDAVAGLAFVNMGILQDVVRLEKKSSIKFVYSYKNCDDTDTSTYVRLIFTADMKQDNIISDSTKSVCRNYGSGSLDLGTYFGFSIPNSAGLWIDVTTTPEKVLPTGTVNLDSLKLGSVYNFKYRVSPASEFVCSSEGLEANFSLRIRDAQVAGGALTLCQQQYQAGVSLNLFNHIQGLSDTSLYKRSGFVWYVCADTVVDESTACEDQIRLIGSAAERFKVDRLPFESNGVRKFNFIYTPTDGDNCGPITGDLFLSVVDSLSTTDLTKAFQLCYTDDMASMLNLYQILGVGGLEEEGKFELVSGQLQNPANYDEATGIFNAYDEFTELLKVDSTADDMKYEFVYRADQSTADCVNVDAKITITVTRTIK